MDRIGRNERCPCGSGKKYKHCCIHQAGAVRLERNAPPPEAVQRALASRGLQRAPRPGSLMAEIIGELPDEPFESIHEARAFMRARAQAHNTAPAPGFDGLDPEAMRALLLDPFNASDVLDVHPHQAHHVSAHDVPLLAWIDLFSELLGDEGATATDDGTLPRPIVRLVAERLHAQTEPNLGVTHRVDAPDAVTTEDDVRGLAYVREVLRLAGVLSLDAGTWRITERTRTHLAKGDPASVYVNLFEALTRRIDWFHGAHQATFAFLPRTWPFLLRLLQHHGNEPRTTHHYADALLEAFPPFLDEAIESVPEPTDDTDPDIVNKRAQDRFRHVVQDVAFDRFAGLLGLAKLTPHEQQRTLPIATPYLTEATPLTRQVITFHR